MNERKASPYCHIFREGEACFAYDVNTSALLEVEPALAAVLPLCGALSSAEIAGRLTAAFSPGEVAEALAAIERGRREDGLFSAHRPRIVACPPESPADCERDLRHLVLSVTERCNLRCRYCLHGADLPWVRGHGTRSMSRATALRAVEYFLDRCDPRRKPVISFYGGEPLLEPGLIEETVGAVQAHPRGREALLAIDTNGVLLDDGIRSLALAQKIHLQISLDGPPEIHDRHRIDGHGRETHGRIEENIRSLLRKDPTAAERLTIVATLAPPFDLDAVDLYFAAFPPFAAAGVKTPLRLKVNLADLRGRKWPDFPKHRAALRRQMDDIRNRYAAAVTQGRRDDLGPVVRALCEPALIRLHHRPRSELGPTASPGGPCRLGRRKLHVDVDGVFHPCERTGEAMPLGSLDSDIRADRVLALGQAFAGEIPSRCTECWAIRLCSLCHAHLAAHQVPSLAALPEAACAAERGRIERDLGLLARVLSGPAECRRFLDDYEVR